MEKYFSIRCSNITQEQADQLIAKWGDIANGFEEEENMLIISLPHNIDSSIVEQDLEASGIEFNTTIIEPQNWNQLWESNFEPVVIPDYVEIIAHFHNPSQQVKHTIYITPKMSFGTGHHATTYLMMEAMKELNFVGKSVTDYGTGTGVLAILASKLGAAQILAIDNDNWSIENATENVERNECKNIEIIQAESIETVYNQDIMLMNINKNIILANMEYIKNALISKGYVLFSGLLSNDENEIVKADNLVGLNHIYTKTKGNWICILAQMN